MNPGNCSGREWSHSLDGGVIKAEARAWVEAGVEICEEMELSRHHLTVLYVR